MRPTQLSVTSSRPKAQPAFCNTLFTAIHSPVYCIVSALLRCAQYNGLCSGGGTGLRYQVSSSRTEYAPFQTHHSIPSCSDDGDNPGNGDFYYLPAMLIADGYWANLRIKVLNLTKKFLKGPQQCLVLGSAHFIFPPRQPWYKIF